MSMVGISILAGNMLTALYSGTNTFFASPRTQNNSNNTKEIIMLLTALRIYLGN